MHDLHVISVELKFIHFRREKREAGFALNYIHFGGKKRRKKFILSYSSSSSSSYQSNEHTTGETKRTNSKNKNKRKILRKGNGDVSVVNSSYETCRLTSAKWTLVKDQLVHQITSLDHPT